MKDLSRIKTGKKGEDLAVLHLRTLGYQILERNYRCPLGELDIVARDGDVLVFVEVKSRQTEAFGEPELAVGKTKQKKINLIAEYYLTKRESHPIKARFDVVAVKILPHHQEVTLIRDAFMVDTD
jgi:putative endonuclease